MTATESKTFVSLVDGILNECEDDHVGLWSVVREVREAMPDASDLDVKECTLSLIQMLLGHRLIRAGFPAANGRDFLAWSTSPEETVRKLEGEWDRLGRAPTVGEIAWFTT